MKEWKIKINRTACPHLKRDNVVKKRMCFLEGEFDVECNIDNCKLKVI